MDAMWRTLGYQTYPASSPAVTVVKVKLPSDIKHIMKDGKVCDLLIYFNRPSVFKELKYTELFSKYRWGKDIPVKLRDKKDLENGYYELNIAGISKRIFLYSRSDNSRTIVRLQMLYITSGAIWYLRNLLLHKHPTSFEDAMTVNGVICSTFQEAAVKSGLITDVTEAMICYKETADSGASSYELICLFITMTLEGFPTRTIYDDIELRKYMLRDIMWNNDALSEKQANNILLAEFQKRLALDNKRNTDFELPAPEKCDTELERHRMTYDNDEQLRILEELNFAKPNNDLQQKHYDTIVDAVVNPLPNKRFFFLNGPGGVGKTTLCQKLQAKFRSMGKIVLICASTTLAALLYPNAITAHRLFNYPVIENDDDRDMDDPVRCDIKEGSERMELIEAATIIFYDEFPSNHKEIWDAIRRCVAHLPNLIFVCSGDFRQILPVITGRPSAEEVIAATVSSSQYWRDFNILTLTENMRLSSLNSQINEHTTTETLKWIQSQTNYGEAILALGMGQQAKCAKLIEELPEEHAQLIGLPGIKFFIEGELGKQRAINWLFPEGFNPSTASEVTILASTNKAVDKWNDAIQEMNPSELRSLFSEDKFCEVDDPYQHLQRNLKDRILNTFNSNGVPHHELKLKVNDVCILLRPVNSFNLATNSRVRILQINPFRIKAQTLGDNPKVVYIPRMRFKFRLPYGQSFQLVRTQFPLRLAYCMTYNKSQSQT
jgi:hypothetical protein